PPAWRVRHQRRGGERRLGWWKGHFSKIAKSAPRPLHRSRNIRDRHLNWLSPRFSSPASQGRKSASNLDELVGQFVARKRAGRKMLREHRAALVDGGNEAV